MTTEEARGDEITLMGSRFGKKMGQLIMHKFLGSLDISPCNTYFLDKNPSHFKHPNKIQI